MTANTHPPSDQSNAWLGKVNWSAGPWGHPRPLWVGIGIGVMLVLPWVLSQISGGNFVLHLLILIFAWGMVVQCWNLIMGVSGIFSFGQLGLYAVGGFGSGVLAQQLGWSPWLAIWIGPLMAVVAAVIIGLPVLRLKGAYVVLLTLAFHELLRNWITNGPSWISGGGYGLRYVPKLAPATWFGDNRILNISFNIAGLDIWLGGEKVMLQTYYLGLVFFGVCTFAVWRILYSPIGMSFRALRDSETYAISRGVDPYRFKLFLFAFSAFFTGLAGAYLTFYDGAISPAVLDFGKLIILLAMIALGGWGSFWGPILGTVLLTVLPELLRTLEGYRNLSMGLALALIAMFAPQGLFSLIFQAIRGLRRVRLGAPAPRPAVAGGPSSAVSQPAQSAPTVGAPTATTPETERKAVAPAPIGHPGWLSKVWQVPAVLFVALALIVYGQQAWMAAMSQAPAGDSGTGNQQPALTPAAPAATEAATTAPDQATPTRPKMRLPTATKEPGKETLTQPEAGPTAPPTPAPTKTPTRPKMKFPTATKEPTFTPTPGT